MAYVQERSTKRYIGTSLDSKPTPQSISDAIPIGSECLETDTGNVYVWTGSDWIGEAAGATTNNLLSAMLLELNNIGTTIRLLASTKIT